MVIRTNFKESGKKLELGGANLSLGQVTLKK